MNRILENIIGELNEAFAIEQCTAAMEVIEYGLESRMGHSWKQCIMPSPKQSADTRYRLLRQADQNLHLTVSGQMLKLIRLHYEAALDILNTVNRLPDVERAEFWSEVSHLEEPYPEVIDKLLEVRGINTLVKKHRGYWQKNTKNTIFVEKPAKD